MKALVETLALVGGASLVVYGAWLVYAPAGFLAAGALLMTAAALSGRKGD